jgi:hypothetical protein
VAVFAAKCGRSDCPGFDTVNPDSQVEWDDVARTYYHEQCAKKPDTVTCPSCGHGFEHAPGS